MSTTPVHPDVPTIPVEPAEVSPGMYMWYVNPLNTYPGSNIRQVRPAFVDQLVEMILKHGWEDGSFPTVYEPIEGSELRDVHTAMTASELQNMKFQIMDGAHRLAALRRLQSDPSVENFGPDFKIKVIVKPRPVTSVQCAVDAAGLNSTGIATVAKRTFCDEIWTNLGIQTDFVHRLVAFNEGVLAAEAAASEISRGKVPFKKLADLPLERKNFVTGYAKHVDEKLYEKRTKSRVQFDPAVHDFPTSTEMISMLTDSVAVGVGVSNLVQDNNLNRVKWRITRLVHPMHTKLTRLDAEDKNKLGGSGIVRAGHDTRVWDYMCLVNSSLQSESSDALSYHRLYNPYFYRAIAVPLAFCAVLMMQKLQSEEKEGGRGQKKKNSTGSAALLCGMTTAAYKQYDAATALVPGFSSIEELIYPYIALDRVQFKFAVLPGHIWSGPSERICFDGAEAEVERLHPLHQCPLGELTIAERAKDIARRKLAALFLTDIEGLKTDGTERASSFFGFKLREGEGRNAADAAFADVPVANITAYVRGQFACLTPSFGFPSTRPAESSDHEAGPSEAVVPREDRAPSSDEIDEVQPAKKKPRPMEEEEEETAVVEAKAAAQLHLNEVDQVFMMCATFQDWSKTTESQSICGKVALILTDPPYNTRRAAGASNSDHDHLSTTEMNDVGNVIADLLRPTGQAYIFCSFMQGADWVRALRAAGGGDVLSVSEKPEFVIRHKSAIISGGRFLYHRASAGEVAIHAYKRQNASRPGAPTFDQLFPPGTTYGDNVDFGNPAAKLASASAMPTYASAFTNYRPPSGVRLLKIDGAVVRPEQKGVDLLRDIIRMFAPKPADIVVDLFGGTMSTVVAAMMEGHPVYACEPDAKCFDAATARVHAFQYRRVANGLLATIGRAHAAALASAIPPCREAVDILDGEEDAVAALAETEMAEMDE